MNQRSYSPFDNRREREAPGGIPRAGKRGANVEVAHVNVADPLAEKVAGTAPKRIRVAMNIRASILDWERSRGLIDDGQHQAGKVLEELFALASGGGGGGDAGVRLDPGRRKELAIILGIDRAFHVVEVMNDIRSVVGATDARVLRLVLGERWAFDAIAREIGEPGARGAWYAAKRYRDALAALARDWWNS